MSALPMSVEFDPLRDKTYRRAWFAPTKELLDTIAELADPPRELIQSDPAPPALTEDERWEAMAQRVRALVSGRGVTHVSGRDPTDGYRNG